MTELNFPGKVATVYPPAVDKGEYRVYLDPLRIKKVVQLLADSISRDYAKEKEPLLLVGVLKGSFVFLADLCREITVPHEIDFLAVSSYGAETESSGVVRIIKDLNAPIEGKHVLLVEDIVDTGHTLKYILNILEARKPLSLKVCTLLDKRELRKFDDIQPDYSGFVIPNKFVFGYGLDINEEYRHLPFVAYKETE